MKERSKGRTKEQINNGKKREARKDWTLTDTAGSNCCIRTALPLAVVEVACLHIPAAAPLPNDPATFSMTQSQFTSPGFEQHLFLNRNSS